MPYRATVRRERREHRMGRAPRVHGIQFGAPPREQPQALGGIADLVGQIVRPAAVGVHVVEILMEALGQQKADDVESSRSDWWPASACRRGLPRPARSGRAPRANGRRPPEAKTRVRPRRTSTERSPSSSGRCGSSGGASLREGWRAALRLLTKTEAVIWPAQINSSALRM